MTGPGLWKIVLEDVAESAIPVFEVALADLTTVVAGERDGSGNLWTLSGYAEARPDTAAVRRSVTAAARAAGTTVPVVVVAEIPRRDWVGEQERTLPPVDVGRFRVFGSHVKESPPPGAVPVRIDAGLAFGTGRHASTAGCLTAIDGLLREGERPSRPLDVGTGSGILGIALALCLDVSVLATDTDPVAVRVATENARINGVVDRFSAFAADGFDCPEIARNEPRDLVVANIFAGPLIDLAPAAARTLGSGGRLILSGMLDAEADSVARTYEAVGVDCTDRVKISGWTTLVALRRS